MTDQEWYDFLASRPEIDEVNFWRPGGAREFRILTPGEPFFFKTHYPHNRVVGGGLYSGFAQLPVSEAWESSIRPMVRSVWIRCFDASAATVVVRWGPRTIQRSAVYS